MEIEGRQQHIKNKKNIKKEENIETKQNKKAEKIEKVKDNKIKKAFLSPIIALNKLTGWIMSKTLGVDSSVMEETIISMVGEGNERGLIEDTRAEIIKNTFEFYHLEISDVMTHRTDVIAVKSDANLDEVVRIALEKGFSRIPVYNETVDNIVGIIIVKDLLGFIGGKDYSNLSASNFMREGIYVPETASCSKLFKTFKDEKAGMAIVVDEYGGTAGIVTTEDLIEEIMGDIIDEYDTEKPPIQKLSENKYDFDGSVDPEEALEVFDKKLPENHEYETLSGFIIDLLGYIPEEAKKTKGKRPYVDYEGIRFIVKGMRKNRINRVFAFKKGTTESVGEH